jgi:transposase
MAKKANRDPKSKALHREGSLHPHPEQVKDELFLSPEFFDPRDLVQVKYEILRRVQSDGQTVSQSAARFGFSRPSFYQAQATFEQGGLPALIARKRPKRAHQLTTEVLAFIRQAQREDSSLRSAGLAVLVKDRYGITVHPCSIERVLTRGQKKCGERRPVPWHCSAGLGASLRAIAQRCTEPLHGCI